MDLNKAIEILKDADFYHLLGDNQSAKEKIKTLNNYKEWREFILAAEKFYDGMTQIFGTTEKLKQGVNKINDAINKLEKLIDWPEIISWVCSLKVELKQNKKTDSYTKSLKEKLADIQEQIKTIKPSAETLPKSKTDSENIFVVFLILVFKQIASIDFEHIRRKYQNRIKQSIKSIREDDINNQVASMFDSIKSQSDILKEAEIIFSLEIFFSEGYLDSSNKMQNIYMTIIAYIRRGFTQNLNKNYEKAFNDYLAAKNVIMLSKTGKLEEKDKCYLNYLVIFIKVLKGDLYYYNYNYELASEYYCIAMRDWDKYKNDNKSITISYRVSEAMMQKSKVFYDKGKFRDSIIWAFHTLVTLLKINYSRSKKENLQEIISSIEKNIIVQLQKEKDANDIVSKKAIINILTKVRPCELIKYFKDDKENYDFSMLASIALNQIGFTGFTLKLDEINSESFKCAATCKQPSFMKKKDVVCHYLHSAHTIDPEYGFAIYDMGLYILKNEKKLDKEEIKGMIGQLTNSTFRRDALERKFAVYVLDKIRGFKFENNRSKNLLMQMITDIDKFFIVPREIAKYLVKERVIDKKEIEDTNKFVLLRRWSSYTPRVPRPRITNVKGGGYFLIWQGKGIVIDPGFDFITNLYNEGYSISDIDGIILTHAHIDHSDDFVAILSLIFQKNHLLKNMGLDTGRGNDNGVDLFLNPGTFQNYTRWITSLEGMQKKKDRSAKLVYPLPVNAKLDLKDKYNIEIETIEAKHDPYFGIGEYSVGVILNLFKNKNDISPQFKIGITSDTDCYDGIEKKYVDCDMLVAHLGHARFLEVAAEEGLMFSMDEDQEICNLIRNNGREVKELLLALGCRLKNKDMVDNFFSKEFTGNFHLKWRGIKKVFNGFNNSKAHKKDKLFVVAEFGEEQKSYRNKLASYLNDPIKKSQRIKSITGDIGLHVGLGVHSHNDISIRCNKCRQNNNISVENSFHDIKKINEVCIKQNDEGMIYLCPEHDSQSLTPGGSKEEFIERFERYCVIR